MPGGGLQALREIVGQSLPVKIVMLTVCDSLSNVQQAMQSGAAGFVPKGIDGDDLARILRDVHSGRKHVNPDLAARLFEESTFGAEDGAPELPSIQLTEREAQIHALIGKGMSNAEIASKLGLKETTVKQYSSYLFQKLGVKNRTAAALRLK
jgi:DNA-binding NarL/FixJ family response regulator